MDKYKDIKETSDFNTHEEISKQAYFFWLNAGCPDNRSLDFWLQAEDLFCPKMENPKCTWCQDRGWVYGESENRPYGEACPMCEKKS